MNTRTRSFFVSFSSLSFKYTNAVEPCIRIDKSGKENIIKVYQEKKGRKA